MSSMRKRRGILAVGLIVILAIAIVVLLRNRTSPLNQENLRRIEIGMTLDEVSAILGIVPGDHSNCQMIFYEDGDKENFDAWAHLAEGAGVCWIDETGSLCVGLDHNGRVNCKCLVRGQPRSEGLARFLRKLFLS